MLLEHDFELKEEVSGAHFNLFITKVKPTVSFCLIFNECLFDPQTSVAAQVELNKILEELKIRLREGA